MHNFKELKVWQKTRMMVKEVYMIPSKFPATERYNLIAQMRSCSVSVMPNIAEGAGRGTDADFARFLDMSLGSAYELESQLIVSSDLDYLSQEVFDGIIDKVSEIQKMLIGLINKFKKK